MNSHQYLTLSWRDQATRGYLDGSFSRELIALPVPQTDILPASDRITFQLVRRSDIELPNLMTLVLTFTRANLLGLSLLPFLVTIAVLRFQELDFSLLVMGLALLSLVSLHVAVFSLNDYRDHMNGLDRLHPERGSRVIQWGWLTAKEVRRVAMVAIVAALLFGLPVFLVASSWSLLGIALMAGAAAFAYSYAPSALFAFGFREILIFLFFGPFLAIGSGLSLTELLPQEVVVWSLGFGAAAVLVFLCRQMEHLWRDVQLKAPTLFVRLGFDRGRRWLTAWIIATGILWCLVFVANFGWHPVTGIAIVVQAFATLFLVRQTMALRSPLGSPLRRLPSFTLRWHYLTGLMALSFRLLL